MSYRQNWLRHTLASVGGHGFSRDLAIDFWPHEALWDAGTPVRRRWSKLLYVYSASAVAQIVVPLIPVAILIDLTKGLPFKWWLIVLGGAAFLGIVFAFGLATLTYVTVLREARGRLLPEKENTSERADRGLARGFWLAFVIGPAIVLGLLMWFGGFP